MSQVRDSAIKFFGADIHNIHIPIKPTTPSTDLHSLTQIQPLPQPIIIMNGLEESTNDEVDVPFNEEVSSKQTDPQEDGNDTPRNICKNPRLKLVAKVVHRTNEHRNAKRNIDQEKVFKKPDKVLQCPRCNSLETKFCYFNNYNVNQPRHFCKNCQRYWTAGGAIRNVPVGAGKRKNKHSALQYCQKPVTPDGASAIQIHSCASSDDMILSSNELSVTSRPIKEREETPLSESLETVLSLNGQRKFDVDFSTIKDDGEDPSSSSMRSNEIEQVGLAQHSNDLIPLHSFHYHPVPSWSYQWNPCWNVKEFRSSSTSSRPPYTGSPTMMTVSGFSIPTVMLPAAPYSYSGFMSSLAGQKEESSLIGSAFSGISLSSSSVSNSTSSGNRSPTLGKHSRDGSTLKEAAMKQNLWVPKTVRINGPEEAANSSIWTTLGTKSEQNKIIIKGSVFKSFESKTSADDNQIRRTNPAAFSRSESFQESM